MAALTVELSDRNPPSISEVGPDIKETPSTSPSASVLETIKVMKELFPWWFRDPYGVIEPADQTPHQSLPSLRKKQEPP